MHDENAIHNTVTITHQTWDSVSSIGAFSNADAIEIQGERGIPLGAIVVAPARAASVTGEQIAIALRIYPMRNEGPTALVSKGAGQFLVYQPDGDSVAFAVTTTSYTCLSVPVPENWYDTWHTLAAVYTGTALELYIDGTLQGSLPATGLICYGAGGLVFGRHPFLAHGGKGIVAAFRLYDRALPAEVLADMDAPPAEGCRLDFRFHHMNPADDPGQRASSAQSIDETRSPWHDVMDRWEPDMEMVASATLCFPPPQDMAPRAMWAEWEIGADGEIRQSGQVALRWCTDEGLVHIPANYAMPEAEAGTEFWLTICLHDGEPGHRDPVAWKQFALPVAAPPLPGPGVDGLPPIEIHEKDNTGYFKGQGFTVEIDLPTATITSWTVDDEELLELGPIHQFWRAPSWDEAFTGGDASLACQWSRAGLAENLMGVTAMEALQSVPAQVVLQFKGLIIRRNSDVLFEISRDYTIFGNGEILLRQTLIPKGPMPLPGRLGLEVRIPKDLNRITWFGRGPKALFVHSRAGDLIGRYSGRADGQFPADGWPMEHGHKSDVRWLTVRNKAGRGLFLASDRAFTASVSPYSTFQLTEALHGDTLGPDSAFTIHIDDVPDSTRWEMQLRMRGLGPADRRPWAWPKTGLPLEFEEV